MTVRDDTIYLEATGDLDDLKIGAYSPRDVIWRYDDVKIPIRQIRSRCREMTDMLNTASRNGGGGLKTVERLKDLGRMLADELLPRTVKERLVKTADGHLVLNLDDHLVDIPWELLCIDADFLCQRFAMGRVVKTRQDIVRHTPRSLARPLKMWILANPGGDLAVADEEGIEIFQEMVSMNQGGQIIAPSLDSDVTCEDIREALKGYDFVHFAGHAEYRPDEPDQSGWKLSGGHFTVSDIDRMAGGAPMPAMVFSNACQSARTDADVKALHLQNGSFSLTHAFLRAGVKHYVGTSWEIMDEPGSYFAKAFYERLGMGKTAGEAVREARRQLTEQLGPDICWCSYLLYGDPTVRYFRADPTQPGARMVKEQAVIRPNTPTRGGLFNYSLTPNAFKNIQGCFYFLVTLALVFGGGGAGVWMHHRMTQEEEQTQSAREMEIREMLTRRADRQQSRTEELFNTLTTIAGPQISEAHILDSVNPPKPDSTLTLATVFDSAMLRTGREKIVLYAIQERIIAADMGFKLVEQESFDIVLEELIRNIRLTRPENRVKPDLLMPRLILVVEIHDTPESMLILMRLVERDSRVIIDTMFQELDNRKKILEQKTVLTQKLLENLKNYEKRLSG